MAVRNSTKLKAMEAHRLIQNGTPGGEAFKQAGISRAGFYRWRAIEEKRELRAAKLQSQVIAAANVPVEDKIAVVLKVRPSDLYKLLAYV